MRGVERMATEHNIKLQIAELSSNCLIDAVKASFCKWLSDHRSKSNETALIISSLDNASEQMLKRNIIDCSLWEITKPAVFIEVYNRARDNKFFRVMDKKIYLAFMRNGQVFLKFLKSKPVIQIDNTVKNLSPSDKQKTAPMTIKDAVVTVLTGATQALTANEIYEEIVKRRLYTFGAQNPVNVVRNIIESACDNSTYSEQNRASVSCFHFEVNDAGKRVYRMLNDMQKSNHQPDNTSVYSSSFSNIVDFEEGKAGIREILEAHFQTLYGYSNIGILWNAAQNTLSLFLNDNAINTADQLWRFTYLAFANEYVMNYPHIWKTQPNCPQSYVGVIINLARQLGGIVTREQIDDYFARIKQRSPINATLIRQGLLMFYAPKHFILSEMVELTNERCAAITKALNRLFECEKVSYIILRDITSEWFSSLPTIKSGLSWTALLLQESLRLRPDIGYRVVFSGLDGQALDTLGAAIVPNESDISCFADLVHRYCQDREILGKRMAAEELRTLLRDAGMLEGNELIYNLHKALKDYRFAFTDENRMVKILER
mgnify:CR=1 FL=1